MKHLFKICMALLLSLCLLSCLFACTDNTQDPQDSSDPAQSENVIQPQETTPLNNEGENPDGGWSNMK